MTEFEAEIAALRQRLDALGRGIDRFVVDENGNYGGYKVDLPVRRDADDLQALELNLIAIRGTAAYIGNWFGVNARKWPT